MTQALPPAGPGLNPAPRVLVTGGTGVLGTRVVQHLRTLGATVRVLSRRARSPQDDLDWAQGDLTTGTGLTEALSGVDIIVHAATTPLRPHQDLTGTRHLLRHARQAGVQHVLYVSIVGIDTPGPSAYYSVKRAVEHELQASGLPYTTVRSTQFHAFIASLLRRLTLGPLLLLPSGVTLQPVDADAVAARVAHAALRPPAGRLPDLRGPERHTLEDLAQSWLLATGQQKWTLSLPLPVPLFQAMRDGRVTSHTAEPTGPSWTDWLKHTARNGPLQ